MGCLVALFAYFFLREKLYTILRPNDSVSAHDRDIGFFSRKITVSQVEAKSIIISTISTELLLCQHKKFIEDP